MVKRTAPPIGRSKPGRERAIADRGEHLVLSARDSIRVLKLLQRPPKPTARLLAAVRRRQDRKLDWDRSFRQMAKAREDWSDLTVVVADGLDPASSSTRGTRGSAPKTDRRARREARRSRS